MSKHAKTYIVLLLIIAVLLVGRLLFKEKPEEDRLWNLAPEKVARLQVTERGKDKPLVLVRDGDEWLIEQPLQAVANKEDVDRMAKSLAELKFRTDYRDETGFDEKEYGLDRPEVVVMAWDRHGEKLCELKIGEETELSGHLWSLADGKLCTISTFIKTDFTKDPQDLRDKKLARFERADARSLRLQYKNHDILCEKTEDDKGDDTWRLRRPVETKADDFEVDGVVGTIADLEAKDFVAPEAGKALQDYGLDKPQLTATVTLDKGDPVVIKLGKRTSRVVEDASATATSDEPEDLIYAQRGGRDEVVLVPYTTLADLAKQVDMLRSKQIWAFDEDDVEQVTVKRTGGLTFSVLRGEDDDWQILEPKKTAADREFMDDLLWAYADLDAHDFVEDSPKDLEKYDLKPPRIEVTFDLVKNRKKTLLIGSQAGLNYHAMEKGGTSVYTISEYKVDKLPSTLAQIEKKEPAQKDEERPEGAEGATDSGGDDESSDSSE
jgi:hypothetical protein